MILNALVLAATLATYPVDATATQAWTTESYALEAGFEGLLFIDYLQTRYKIQATERTELNPILGPSPSNQQVAAYLFEAGLLHAVAMALLPDNDLREAIQLVSIGFEGAIVANNVMTRGSFPFVRFTLSIP